MALETGVVYVDDLVAANPPDGDNANQGAEHLRNIKTALAGSLPHATYDLRNMGSAIQGGHLYILDGTSLVAAGANMVSGYITGPSSTSATSTAATIDVSQYNPRTIVLDGSDTLTMTAIQTGCSVMDITLRVRFTPNASAAGQYLIVTPQTSTGGAYAGIGHTSLYLEESSTMPVVTGFLSVIGVPVPTMTKIQFALAYSTTTGGSPTWSVDGRYCLKFYS